VFDNLKINYNITDQELNLIKLIDNNLSKIDIDDSKKEKYIKTKSKVRSIHSSLAIEANSLSLNDVNNIMEDNIIAGIPKDVQEVKNAIEVYEHINEYDNKNEKDLIKAHSIFMKYYDDDNGKYRNHGEGVKRKDKLIFRAPDSFFVPNFMSDLFNFLNNSDLHPYLIASIFHYYFVYIHPFSDGNGRLARFWVSLILKSYNYKYEYIPIEEEIYNKQEEYYKSIDKCHNNKNANEFIKFMLNVLYESTNKIINNIIKLTETEKNIYEFIKDNPNSSTSFIAEKLKLSDRTIRRCINILIKYNMIESSSNVKNDPTKTYYVI